MHRKYKERYAWKKKDWKICASCACLYVFIFLCSFIYSCVTKLINCQIWPIRGRLHEEEINRCIGILEAGFHSPSRNGHQKSFSERYHLKEWLPECHRWYTIHPNSQKSGSWYTTKCPKTCNTYPTAATSRQGSSGVACWPCEMDPLGLGTGTVLRWV